MPVLEKRPENDRCRAYDLRPLRCRVHTSRSVDDCASMADPIPHDAWLTRVGEALEGGLGGPPPVELHQALREALGA